MLSNNELVEKNKYLARKLTAEWLKNAYLRKQHEIDIRDLVASESRKVDKLTRTLKQLQEEFELLQDEVEDLREEKGNLIKEVNEKDYTGSVGKLRDHVRTLEGLLGKKCENCGSLKKENERLG
jgi:tRNA/tmRNA/rRNA uracil-C5-methylase (TrmA/RlmC/RlmD family)